MVKLYKLIFWFLMLIIASYLIPTIGGLPLTPAAEFYVPFWLILISIICPQLFFSKGFFIGYLFLILHVLYDFLSFYPPDRDNIRYMMDEVLPIIFSFSLLEYFIQTKRFNDFIRISNLVIFGTLLTIITSAFGLTIYPDAARGLAGGLRDNQALVVFYHLIGIGGFYFYIYLAILPPILIFIILRIKRIKIKLVVLLIYIFTFITILLSQYTASIALFVLSSIATYTYLKTKSITAYILLMMISFLLYFNKEFISQGIIYFAEIVNLENVSPRLKNIAYMIEGENVDVSAEELKFGSTYEELKKKSLDSFNENIVTGGGKIGDHVFWYDVLGNYGLLGLIPWLLFFSYLLKSRKKLFFNEFKGIFYVTVLSLIFIGFHKPLRSFQILPFITFFIPVILLKVQRWMTNDKTFIKS